MLSIGEVDGELRGEIGEECSKYGEVVDVMVRELPTGTAPEEESVRAACTLRSSVVWG